MKQLLTFTIFTIIALTHAVAQEVETTSDEKSTIYLNDSGDSVQTDKNGGLSLQLNGIRFNIGGNKSAEHTEEEYYVTLSDGTKLRIDESQIEELSPAMRAEALQEDISTKSDRKNRVHLAYAGIGAPGYNHLAAIEIGSNIFSFTDYSAYSPEEAAQLAFTRSKSTYLAVNLLTMNVALNRSRSLVFSTAFGFACDNYTFAGNYTMENRDGMMHAMALDPSIKKSKLTTSCFHFPLVFDWNIGRGWFISAGANVDILLGSALVYKKPKTTIEGVTTLNPVQVSITARFGWRRLYGFVNYSPIGMFKSGTGPKIHRMSIGVGIWL